MREPVPGKGEALRAGVAAVPDASLLVFLDGDLVGLRPDHVDRLVGAVGVRRRRHGVRLVRPGPGSQPHGLACCRY